MQFKRDDASIRTWLATAATCSQIAALADANDRKLARLKAEVRKVRAELDALSEDDPRRTSITPELNAGAHALWRYATK